LQKSFVILSSIKTGLGGVLSLFHAISTSTKIVVIFQLQDPTALTRNTLLVIVRLDPDSVTTQCKGENLFLQSGI